MKVLITGGSGYIGSHICMELLLEGMDAVVIDNLTNAHIDNLREIEEYTGKKIAFYEGDVRDRKLLDQIFQEHEIDAVIHLAAKKSISESVKFPVDYYDNNISGTLQLLETMRLSGCRTMYFSSSASVYGPQEKNPITEEFTVGGCTNAYARSKLMAEEMLEDLYQSDASWNITVFRYFNPIGAHHSGVIGEEPNELSTNLMPCLIQAVSGQRDDLKVYGNDYPTPDGTGVRDYIHVVDLAKAHVCALRNLEGKTGYRIYNLGTGTGYSVLELIHTFEKVTGLNVPYGIAERRPGDLASCYCSSEKARKELGWETYYDLEDMCRTTWKWHKNLLRREKQGKINAE